MWQRRLCYRRWMTTTTRAKATARRPPSCRAARELHSRPCRRRCRYRLCGCCFLRRPGRHAHPRQAAAAGRRRPELRWPGAGRRDWWAASCACARARGGWPGAKGLAWAPQTSLRAQQWHRAQRRQRRRRRRRRRQGLRPMQGTARQQRGARRHTVCARRRALSWRGAAMRKKGGAEGGCDSPASSTVRSRREGVHAREWHRVRRSSRGDDPSPLPSPPLPPPFLLPPRSQTVPIPAECRWLPPMAQQWPPLSREARHCSCRHWSGQRPQEGH